MKRVFWPLFWFLLNRLEKEAEPDTESGEDFRRSLSGVVRRLVACELCWAGPIALGLVVCDCGGVYCADCLRAHRQPEEGKGEPLDS